MTPFLSDETLIETFLREQGAAGIPHPGGTLLEHLRRVAACLASWGAPSPSWAAGYCHASYGTDGFDTPLMSLADRPVLQALIGPDAERLVYVYASCDRAAVYPRLDGTPAVNFRDRFRGEFVTLANQELRAFAELTVANELDLLRHDRELAARHGGRLASLFQRMKPLLSPAAARAVDDQFWTAPEDRAVNKAGTERHER
jgi:hypothetical protein